MSEERFADLFTGKITTPKIQPGDRIDAVIAGISGENVFLDIGGKSEGVMAAAELRNNEGEITARPGDTVSVFMLAGKGGEMVFTTRVGTGQASLEEIETAFHSGIPVEGQVTTEVKGGFEVTVAHQRCFCPYSQMDIRRIEDPGEYLGRTLQFRIIEFGNDGRNIILSARALLEEERRRRQDALKESLREGDRVRGTVTSLREFGAFVDIGGIDGLIPISEMAWGQVDRVEDILTRGQEVEVMVRTIDWNSERISLSLKEAAENPWAGVPEKYPVGSIQTGRVARLVQFGAFVTLEPGIDGLLHISKLGSGRKIHHPREVLEAGQKVIIRIESVDTEKQRISLAPENYTTEPDTVDERMEQQRAVQNQPKSLGTLGDLLGARMNERGPRK